MNHYYCVCLVFLLSSFSPPLSAQMIYIVNTVVDSDDGACDGIHCSLREAINAANNDEVASIIQFSFSNDTIRPASLLPPLLESQTTIDATTQSGVVLDGSHPIVDGLIINGDNMMIQGLKIINFSGSAIVIHNATNALIGGATANLGNSLCQNGNYGILLSGTSNSSIIQYNQISENNFHGIATVDDAINNRISQNAIYCNRQGGITLTGGNPTPPTINTSTNTTISGTADPHHLIELFSTSPSNCETDNFCQGKTYLGNITADMNGDWSFNASNANLLPGQLISATATDNLTHTSEFSTCVILANTCPSAYELTMNDAPCEGAPITADFTFATSSLVGNPPMNACAMDYDVQDLWFKVTVPESGNLLIRHKSLDSVETLVEVYTGDCQGGLTSILCDTLFQEPNILYLTSQASGTTLYLRVWDAGNDDIGQIQLSAHALPVDLNEAIICNGADGSGARKPSDFIIQYKPNTTEAEIQTVRDELIALGDVQLVDSCACTSPKLELWRVDNPINLEDRRKLSSRKTAVDTVNYNFLILKDDPALGTGQAIDSTSSPGSSNPQTRSVKIAAIDSGIEETHQDLSNAIWRDMTNGCIGNDPIGIGYDFVNGDITPDDVDGHGTSVNGIVVLRTPLDIELKMINGKFYQDGNGDLFDAVCAINYAIEQEAKVINLSWGFKNGGIPSILDNAISGAQANDILLISSAGNTYEDNDQIDKWPANANHDNMITVSAIEVDDVTGDTSLAPYSNYGLNKVHLAAMGFAKTTIKNNMLDNRAGTSIAAPFVTQTAAIIRARYPNLSFIEVKDCILSSVVKLDVLLDTVQTGGVLDQAAALACANDKAGICTETLNLNLLEENNRTYRASTTIISTSTIASGATINYNAVNSITLTPGFQAIAGSQFNATITTCPAALNTITQSSSTKHQAPISLPNISNQQKSTLFIYPNPTNDFVNIKYELKEPTDLQFNLLNVNGQLSKSFFYPNASLGIGQINMEVSTLPPGIYFLQMLTPYNSTVKKLLIKRN